MYVQALVLDGDGFFDDGVPFREVIECHQSLVRDAAGVLDRVVVDELDYLLGYAALVVFVSRRLDSGDAPPALRLILCGAQRAQHRAESGLRTSSPTSGDAAARVVYLARRGI